MRTPSGTEPELAVLAKAGDAEAFGRLVEQFAPAVRRLTRAVLVDSHDADDAAQDSFLSAWRNLASYDSDRPFGPWLLRIAFNAAHDLRRKRKVREWHPIPDSAPSATEAPDRAAGRALLRSRLDEALSQLTERQRLAVLLFDGEGYSHTEIAQLLGVPDGTVRSDVFHARRTLREQLAPFLGGPA